MYLQKILNDTHKENNYTEISNQSIIDRLKKSKRKKIKYGVLLNQIMLIGDLPPHLFLHQNKAHMFQYNPLIKS